jgi:hypothetical protein
VGTELLLVYVATSLEMNLWAEAVIKEQKIQQKLSE